MIGTLATCKAFTYNMLKEYIIIHVYQAKSNCTSIMKYMTPILGLRAEKNHIYYFEFKYWKSD